MTKRVALVHDWLTGMRGGERVLEVLCELFPGAEIFTLLHVRGAVSPTIERHRIHTSPLQRLPSAPRLYRQCLPLFPTLIEWFDFAGFDLVVSTSHCVAKGAIAAARARHVCYCHTPMRYAWDQFDPYFGPARVGRGRSWAYRQVMARLARWDRDTAGRVDQFVTNSHYVAGRISRYYGREATVVYPPVDTQFFQPNGASAEPFALAISALVPYKRLEVAIDASRQSGIPLTIVGSGPDRQSLGRRAEGSPVRFLDRCSDEAIRDLYRRAAMFVLPGEEDFGIAPVEAQACGRPVVALARGGALETVVPGVTGTLVSDPSADAFAAAMRQTLDHPWNPPVIRAHAERFGRERFRTELRAIFDSDPSN